MKKAGYSLVELLIVIAILSALVGMVAPSLLAIRELAQILACRIAYVAKDGALCICDARGKTPMKVYERDSATLDNPKWSPLGDRLAVNVHGGGDYVGAAVIVPGKGEVRLIPKLELYGWLDNDTLFGTKPGEYKLYRANVETGKVGLQVHLTKKGLPTFHNSRDFDYSAHLGRYVLAEPKSGGSHGRDIIVRDIHWQEIEAIWQDAESKVHDSSPRISPCGMYVAWSRSRRAGSSDAWIVALKATGISPEQKPRLLGAEEQSVFLCDWTEGGNLLVTLQRPGGWELAVMDKEGEVLRTLGPVNSYSSVASWRHNRRF